MEVEWRLNDWNMRERGGGGEESGDKIVEAGGGLTLLPPSELPQIPKIENWPSAGEKCVRPTSF